MADFVLDRRALGRIPVVSSQSQNTNSKRCISCRRILNFEFFGDSRTSKDGFNSYCRQCRNQKRRLHYGRSDELFILNLDRNNECRLLKSVVDGEQTTLMKAFSLNDGAIYVIETKISQFSFMFQMSDLLEVPILSFEILIQVDRRQSLDRIGRFLVQELSKLRVRLCDSDEERFQILNPA